MLAAEIRKRRVADMRGYPHWRWHLDEVFAKITASSTIFGAPSTMKARCWRLGSPRSGALKLLKRIIKKHGRPRTIVNDRLRPYPAAMQEIGAADRHEVGERLSNRAEDSHNRFGDPNGRCGAFEV